MICNMDRTYVRRLGLPREVGFPPIPRAPVAVAGQRWSTCATSGVSRAGGHGNRCAASTSTWCWRAAAVIGVFYDRQRRWYRSSAQIELHRPHSTAFLDGASQPDELALRAAGWRCRAMALTGHDSLSWLARVRRTLPAPPGLRPIRRLRGHARRGATPSTLLVESRPATATSSRLISLAHAGDRRAPSLTLQQTAATLKDCTASRGCAATGWLRVRWRRGRMKRRWRPATCAPSSAASGSQSSSAPVLAATPAATGCWASWPPRFGSAPSPPATSTPTPRRALPPGRAGRNPSTPRSMPASGSGGETTRRCCARRLSWPPASRPRRCAVRWRWRRVAGSTSPPTYYAYPTSSPRRERPHRRR